MNGEELLNKMSDVDEGLIIEAEKKPIKKRLFIRLGAVCAAALAITLGVNFIPKLTFVEPPVLELTDKSFWTFGGGGFGGGFEGIHVNDPSELDNGNPWSENMKIRTLPVFTSSSTYPDAEKMKETLINAAEFFGLDIDSLEIKDSTLSDEDIENLREQFIEYGAPDEEIERVIKNSCSGGEVWAKQNGISIDVDTAFCLNIVFEDGIELPHEYNFSKSASEEELSRAGDYLVNEYKDLLKMKKPVKNLHAEYNGSVEFYDGGKSDEDKVVNYSLNFVRFISNDEGKLRIIRIFTDTGCEKIADYPIISAEDAQKLLWEGGYLSSVSYDITGDEEIGRIELMYRSGIGYEYVLPFYRILVKLPEEYDDDKEKSCYGGYYVPAVEGEYLVGVPTKITFNGGDITAFK